MLGASQVEYKPFGKLPLKREVELSGLRHVVDAQDEGQAARKERLGVPSGRPGCAPVLVPHDHVGRRPTQRRRTLPAPVAARRSPTFPRSCCNARHGLSERPAGGARKQSLGQREHA